VAVVATLSKGYDLDYIWKQVDRGSAKDAASYYIQASESGGEPPGRWWGPGALALGLKPGQTVERPPYDLLFGQPPGDLVPGLVSELRGARVHARHRPDPVLTGQAPALGDRLLRAPHQPARPAPSPYPQHRASQHDNCGVTSVAHTQVTRTGRRGFCAMTPQPPVWRNNRAPE